MALGREESIATQVEVRRLFKKFLIILEDFRELHDNAFDKLEDNLPEEYGSLVDQAAFFDDRTYEYYRKKVLDAGNDSLRYIQGMENQ